MTSILPILALLLAAIVLVVVATRLRFPYTIALVGFGILLGWLAVHTPFPDLTSTARSLFTPTLFFDLLLPPIVFEAAIHVDFRLLRKRAPLILSLVLVGVVFTTIFTGYLVSLVAAIPIGAALLLAAILSPTDPLAVVDLSRQLPIPDELSTIVESESLLNDGTGVVLFVLILGILSTGHFSAGGAVLQFLWLAGGGLAIGLAVAGGVYLLHRYLDDIPVETALTVVVAYGSFLLAQAVGTSGIVATATAGIGVGTFVAPRAMHKDVREAVSTFWKVVVYIATSLAFLSMGLLLSVSGVIRYLPLIALVFVVLFAGRALFVYAHLALARLRRDDGDRLPSSWYGTVTLSGVRGAIPVVLALSLFTSATSLPRSTVSTIVSVVLGVAILSIVVNSALARWYVARLFPGREAADASD
jgi:monovalent cation:H+ antiporter, CPA1 family